MAGKRIGDLLIGSGLITEEQLKEALEIQQRCKKRLGEILIELGYINSESLVRMLSEQAAIAFIELRPEMLDENLIKSFPERILYDNIIIPLYKTDDKLHIATGDPTNREIIKKLQEFSKKEVGISGADPEQIIKLLDKYFLIDQTEEVFGDVI